MLVKDYYVRCGWNWKFAC